MTESQRIAAEADLALARLLGRTDMHPDAALGDAYLDRRVADVLTHLHAWHGLFAGWIAAHRSGTAVQFPAEGYTWQALDALNARLHADLAHLDYGQARERLLASHRDMLALLADLNPADAPAWLGGETLGAVAHECLGAHYAWGEGVLAKAGLP